MAKRVQPTNILQEYTPIGLYDAIALTVARISNRIYVGTEFCMQHFQDCPSETYVTDFSLGRNEEFLKNAADYAQAVVVSAEILRVFPERFKPYASGLFPFQPVLVAHVLLAF